jgi:hypothetical protein
MVASFLGGGQMNPFAADPMQLLSTSAMAGDPTPPVQAPAFADPATTGSVSAPPAATTAAPGASSPSDNRGIMDRLGDAFSGRQGLFGSPSADDNEIDPLTGAPKGLARQAGMRSMMQMGLTFLLAGQRMSNDQRAAILSKAPGLIGGGDDALNSFAKTRLEMAKLRMEQQKMQQEQASSQALMRGLGIDSGGGASTPSVGAQGVQAGQQALAQAAPVIDPQQAAMPAGAPAAGAPVMSAGPGREMDVPPTGQQDAAPMPPAPVGALAAPGGVPRMSGAGAGFDPKSLTQAEKLAIVSQPTTAGKSQMFGQIVAARSAGERIGEPQYNSVTGTIQYPKYNGRGEQTGFADGGKPTTTTRDTDKFREEGFTDPRTGQFVVTKRSDLSENPADVREQTLNASILKPEADTYKTSYKDNIAPAVQRYDTLAKVREDVLAGKGIFGTGATTATQVVRGLSTAGLINPKFAEDLMTNQDFLRASKDSVANVIKNFNGSQAVSDSDRKFAVEVVGASLNGTRDEVLNSITNNMKDIRNSIKNHNEGASALNENLSTLPESTQKLLRVKTVDRDFDKPELDYMERYNQRRADMQAKYDGTAPSKAPAAPKYTPEQIAAEMKRRGIK